MKPNPFPIIQFTPGDNVQCSFGQAYRNNTKHLQPILTFKDFCLRLRFKDFLGFFLFPPIHIYLGHYLQCFTIAQPQGTRTETIIG